MNITLSDAPMLDTSATFDFTLPTAPATAPTVQVDSPGTMWAAPRWLKTVYSLASVVGVGLGAYHGYKRNGGSIGWAVGWALLGGAFPVIVIPVAFAQGIGKRK